MAFALPGDRERAWEMFTMLNPVHHGSQPDAIERYKLEPYVMCADVYATPPHSGRTGWTWYTGATGWMYRLSVETLLGLQLQVDSLRIAQCIPADLVKYNIHYSYREAVYNITFKCGAQKPDHLICVTLDGAAVNGAVLDEAVRP
jgi:cyclic beta-1,2-glucan synthetase